MKGSDKMRWDRREFLTRAIVAGTVGLPGLEARLTGAESPQTSRIHMIKIPGICIAPQYVAEELLRAEGFSEVQYVPKESVATVPPATRSGSRRPG